MDISFKIKFIIHKKIVFAENNIKGVIKMEMNTRDTIVKKLLDAQESTRDYQSFANEVTGEEVSSTFKEFAEQSAMQAKKLQELLDTYDGSQQY